MKSNITYMLRVLPALVLGLLMLGGVASAQQSSNGTDPKGTTVATPAPDDAGDFKIVGSIEFGYRGIRVDGDERKYKSDLNYKAGPRLFDSSFFMKSKEDKGMFLNSLMVTSTGWGADPSGQLRIDAEQSEWYRFTANYRRFKYFRALNTLANPNWAFSGFPVPPNPVTGEHNINTKQEIGDFELTIFPKNDRFKFFVGYAPERYEGPAYSNYHAGGNEFNPLENLKSKADDYRFGSDFSLGPVDFSFLQGFRRFKEDNVIDLGFTPGLNPAPTAADLTSWRRNNPVRGKIDYTRFSVHTFLAQRLDITGRLIYSKSDVDNNWVENLSGVNWNTRISGTTYAVPNVLNSGTYNYLGFASRPNTIGDVGITFFATNKLKFSNTFRVETFQINGSNIANSLFLITKNGVATPPLVNNRNLSDFEITKYRKYLNTFEGDYQFNRNYSIHAGYRYGNRWSQETIGGWSLGGYTPPAAPNPTTIEEAENHTHAVFFGGRFKPTKNLNFFFDMEKGTADNVFTRIGNYDYTNVRGKARYAISRRFGFNLAVITRDNANPSEIAGVSLNDFGVSVKSRVFTSTFDINLSPRLTINTGYNYNWVNSNAVVDYFWAGVRHPEGRSIYYMRSHYFFMDSVARLHSRATLFMSYRINKDNGQGNRLANPTGAPGFLVTSYPMSLQGPEARLALRLHRRVDWNVGYQYYNYNESLLVGPRPQNYHAHLPYTSLRIYFGRGE